MDQLTIEQKKDFAKIVYLNEPGITQKELAERVGVSKVTINKWINTEKWEELCSSLLVTKETIIRMPNIPGLDPAHPCRQRGACVRPAAA